MRRKRFALLIGLLMLVAVATMAVAQPGANAATRGEAQLQFLIELPQPVCEPDPADPDGPPICTPASAKELVELVTGACCFQFDVFFEVDYISNIGSSGLDGNTTTFQVDSFFDVFYEIEFDNSPSGAGSRTIQTEMLSMDLSGTLNDPDNPAGAIDAVTKAVNAVGGHVHRGHVTILK